MLLRIVVIATVLFVTLPAAHATCLTDQPLDAQGRAIGDKEAALEAAIKAWQQRVADKVSGGKMLDPARAERWKAIYKQDQQTGEVIVNVSGIPCY